jgi:rhodanese-related sulfurtransferase
MLGYVNDNRARGEASVQWHEVEAFLEQGWQLIDVRTDGEHQSGNIPNTKSIPVDVLRESVDELRGKDVIVTCQVGQRGHTAVQLLRGHGIKARNLDGGYLTWRTGMDSRQRASS